jgi:hypothetical protein
MSTSEAIRITRYQEDGPIGTDSIYWNLSEHGTGDDYGDVADIRYVSASTLAAEVAA